MVYAYVITADSLDPSFWVEIVFLEERLALKWLDEHPSNETVEYTIHEVPLGEGEDH